KIERFEHAIEIEIGAHARPFLRLRFSEGRASLAGFIAGLTASTGMPSVAAALEGVAKLRRRRARARPAVAPAMSATRSVTSAIGSRKLCPCAGGVAGST